VLAAAFVARPLSAVPRGLELRWSAPAGCPDEQQVLATVDQLIGSRESLDPLRAEAAVEERDGRFHLTLSWRTEGARDVRRVDGDTCLELAQAAALIVALAADPHGKLARQGADDANAGTQPARTPDVPSAPERKEVAEPPASGAATPSPARPSERPARNDVSRLTFSARATGAVELGSLPGPSPGGAVGAELTLGSAALALEALTFLPVEERVAGGGGLFWLSALSLRPCLVFGPSRLSASSCLSGEVDVVRSRGRDVAVPEYAWTWFSRFGLGFEGAYRLVPSLSVLLGGTLLLGPSRPRFVVDASTRVHEPELVSGRLQLGFAYRP
jgi:hypothetical protein